MRLNAAAFALASLPIAWPLSAEAQASRTLRLELQGDPGRPFAVENLAGRMHARAGAGDRVVAVATVHAESDELARSVRFEQVAGESGVPTLRVRYPVGRHTAYRFGDRSSSSSDWSWLASLFPFGDGSQIAYDGARVTVSRNRGVLLYAEVEVEVPGRALEATFRNVVGPLSAEGLEGRLRFKASSGEVNLRGLSGEVVADTGSGDVRAADLQGAFKCDTGSGNCLVEGFQGDAVDCDTGSGDVRLTAVRARRVKLDTGSGDVSAREVEAEELVADTGSGDVEVELDGPRLAAVKADTGSGDVRLRLGRDTEFELRADTGSGDLVSRYQDAEPIVVGRRVKGYRRGAGRVRVEVDTGSGDVVIEPR